MKTLVTNRLVIRRMSETDAVFMLSLLNEPSWLRFIGDRELQLHATTAQANTHSAGA